MGLIGTLSDGPVAVDTAIFIYLIEEHPQYLPKLLPLFRQVDAGEREVVTTSLTLLEVLVVPYRARNFALAERYEALLTRSRGVRLVELAHPQLRLAAQIRAMSRVKTPDALQIAAALDAGCDQFLTADRGLRGAPGLRVIDLADV